MATAPLVKHRILIVDDDPDSVEALCTLLRRLGHECRSALGGRVAITVAEAFDPDVAFVDLQLPDVDGYEVARALRARGAPLHLAALTGWCRVADRTRALAAGFDEHLAKPATIGTLSRFIASADTT